MALARLTRTRREIRIEGPFGDLVARFHVGESEDYRDVLAGHSLRPFGRRYDLTEDDGGEVFMVRVAPVEEEVYAGRCTVNLDLFHRQVVLWIDDKRISFVEEYTAREAANALHQAATMARDLRG